MKANFILWICASIALEMTYIFLEPKNSTFTLGKMKLMNIQLFKDSGSLYKL